MKLVSYFATTLVLATAFASAVPTASAALTDYHETSLDLYTNGKLEENGRFAVSIKRIDDLTDAMGNIVAEKYTDIIIAFDVSIDGSITANGMPVSVGLSHVQMEASTLNVVAEGAQKMSTEELRAAYGTRAITKLSILDVGFIDMQIEAVAQEIDVDGVQVTRMTLKETITELNGVAVEQSIAMQQVFEIKNNAVSAHRPCKASSGHIASHHQKTSTKPACGMQAFAKMLRHQPLAARILASVLTGAIFALLLLLTARLFTRLLSLRTYKRVDTESSDDGSAYLKKISLKQTEAGFVIEETSELLPAYGQKMGQSESTPKSPRSSVTPRRKSGPPEIVEIPSAPQNIPKPNSMIIRLDSEEVSPPPAKDGLLGLSASYYLSKLPDIFNIPSPTFTSSPKRNAKEPYLPSDVERRAFSNSSRITHDFGPRGLGKLTSSSGGGGMTINGGLRSGLGSKVIPVWLTWNQGGDTVHITGTFNDWKQKIRMQRSDHDFSTVLELAPGTHRIKFIVDDEWKCSDDLPVVSELDGNLVNYITIDDERGASVGDGFDSIASCEPKISTTTSAGRSPP